MDKLLGKTFRRLHALLRCYMPGLKSGYTTRDGSGYKWSNGSSSGVFAVGVARGGSLGAGEATHSVR